MFNISKILKVELFILFLLTVTSFIVFYYQNALPDNYFLISSESRWPGHIIYYFTSFVAFVGYYVGPWIFIPFFLFSLFYTFSFSKREMLWDVFNALVLTLACLLLTRVFLPDFMGVGVAYLLEKKLGSYVTAILGWGLTIVFLAGAFRSITEKAAVKIKAHFGEFSTKYLSFKRTYQTSESKEKNETSLIPVVSHARLEYKLTPSNEEESTPKQVLKSKSVSHQEKIEKRKELQEESPKKLLDYQSLVNFLETKARETEEIAPRNNYFADIIARVEDKLGEFKIKGKVVNILKGPVVDTFELELGLGVKVSKILNHEADLGLALQGLPIRIVYPMVGRTTIGIEVPRTPRRFIYLDEVLKSGEFQSSQHKLPIAMGKNVFGGIFVVDLAYMPHMLVAGATGAGKSIFINGLLISLLVKKTPEQMRLILIDPKHLELAVYQGLPHLIMPVVTGAKEASLALLWACQEMERRYLLLKEFGVRNIEGLKEKVKEATPEQLAKIWSDSENYELPYLVIIVDEFADIMLTKARQEVEVNISRLAAKARAAGIHLILATQRPSVDVITGVIKSNFPTRVAFKVSSQQDSRTILTTIGAEKLLGKGDGLFRSGAENLRFHSSYVNEKEIEALVGKLSSIPQKFHKEAVNFLEEQKDSVSAQFPSAVEFDTDEELLKRSVQLVVEHRMASASMLQRRLRIGYNRAALLIEKMESQGIIGPAEGGKKRQVLINSGDF